MQVELCVEGIRTLAIWMPAEVVHEQRTGWREFDGTTGGDGDTVGRAHLAHLLNHHFEMLQI